MGASRATLRFLVDRLATPIGEMIVVADEQGSLRAVDWTDYESRMVRLLERFYGADGFVLMPASNPHGLLDPIREYFAGRLSALDSLPVTTAGTPFQREVWHQLRQIPCGTSISYAALAERIGNPKAVRAVGLANGANPVGVIVPCHRVVGASGALTGYGGGTERKRWLLRHEAQQLTLRA